METGDKNRNMSQRHTLFCEKSLGKIDAKDVKLFWNGSVREFYCLKEFTDYFGESEYFSENFDGEAINWSGVVNFHCVQMSLVMSMHLFLVMIDMTCALFIVFLVSSKGVISLELIFVYLYTRSQSLSNMI